jgi:hypothetical protein
VDHAGSCHSVVQAVGVLGQLLGGSFRVPSRRVQVLMAEDLRQGNEIVLVVR